MEQQNQEHMTWPEWAYAAGVPEPAARGIGLPAGTWDPVTQTFEDGKIYHSSHAARGYAAQFRKERAAWRSGVAPTEWRMTMEHANRHNRPRAPQEQDQG